MEPLAYPARVILGNLEPIMRLGLARALAEAGADVIAEERLQARIVAEAGRLKPDVVVLDLDAGVSRAMCEQVRAVAPDTKVILWARDESVMEVLDPESDIARLVPLGVPEDLRRELVNRRGQQVEE